MSVEAVNAMVAELFPGARDRCAELGPDWALARRDVDAADIRPGGYISGPVQFGLADATLWFLSFAALGRIEPMAVTSELSIRYLRPAQGPVLRARARLESIGRRQLIGTATVWVDDERQPTAVAQGTYVFPAEAVFPAESGA
ncbi:MAG: PaaI family thioesterase [Austwickia sp.]|nr:PaaI family thioesterase [Austwickia sp.]MBK8436602.1 PaaI family thioesterase [Austwickia sp.]MBK9102267.1 PaaI family thioesterase [Austwickia sp.]